MHRAGLIVGNGLSIDLINFLGHSLETWDPQRPLEWNLSTPGNKTIPLLESLPRFSKAIGEIRQKEKNLSDFDIFERTLRRFVRCQPPNYEMDVLEAEARHFLAIAYSHFQLKVDSFDIEGWPWLTWIKNSKAEFVGVVSFNYDLVIERALERAGLISRRFGIRLEISGVPILKPHGSIDFEVEGIVMPVGYPLQNVALKNFFPLRRLDKAELLQPRTEVDLVLPSEYSPQSSERWVAPGYQWFQEVGPSLTQCIFMGLSYWHCDRPEINFLLDALHPDTKIIIANPYPDPEFCEKVWKRFRNIEHWKDGPN